MYSEFLNEHIISWFITTGIELIIIIIIAKLVSVGLHNTIEKIVRKAVPSHDFIDSASEKKREDTLIRVFSGTMKILLYGVTFMLVLSALGVTIGPVLAGAGVAGVAFGFGAQYLVRDLISGFFIILENQFRVGDAVEVAGITGIVENVTLRVTTVRNLDGILHFVPNGEMKVVANKSKDFSRVNLVVGVSYGADIDKVIDVVNSIGEEIAHDEVWGQKILKAPQFLRVDNLGESSVDVRIVGETKPLEQWSVAGELRKRIKQRFDKEGIEIPFPQRVVTLKQ
jgi:small conductance mechanosensitive channel